MNVTRMLSIAAMLVAAGCYQGGPQLADDEVEPAPPGRVPPPADGGEPSDGREPGDGDDDGDDDGADSGEPGHHGEGEVEETIGRRMRRMTAAQFHRSLVTVTGQPWPLFDEYAAAMGQADFAEITDEGRELSVTFDKFVHDAALHSCAAAITADLDGASPATILRWVDVSERDLVKIHRNLDYLMLRFLGQEMGEEDPRVEPWLALLTQSPSEDDPEAAIDDALMRERWTAVCIGLATHPDFLTY